MSSRLVSAATFCLVLLVSGACGPESSPATEEEAGGTTSGEVKRPLNMEDAVAAGFTKETQTLYSQIAAEDGWQGTFDGIRVQIYVFPEIVPGYVPTSFFTDAVKKEATWQAHRIVRNVGILCGTEGACAKLEKELRVAGGGSPQPKSRVAQSPDQPTGQEDKAASERQMAQPDPGPEAKTVARGADGQPAPAETSGAGAEPASQPGHR